MKKIKIKFNDIYWNVFPIEILEPNTNKRLVRLEWGWGAGMTDEERIQCEKNNVPAGFKSVTMNMDGVAMLFNNLLEILQKNPNESKIGKYILDHIEIKKDEN